MKLVLKLIDIFCKLNGGVIFDLFVGLGIILIVGLFKEKEVVGFDLS